METLRLLNEMADKKSMFERAKADLLQAFGPEYVSVFSLTAKNINRLDKLKDSIFMNDDLGRVLQCADILRDHGLLQSPLLLKQFAIFIRPFDERNPSNAKPFSPSRDYFKRD